VGPLGIVIADPVFDHAFGLEPVLQFVQINGLLFQGPPQPFDEDVVELATPPIHRYFDIRLGQSGVPSLTRELGSLVRIYDLWLAHGLAVHVCLHERGIWRWPRSMPRHKS